MRLARIDFDDTVVIALGKETGAESRQDLRDSSFRAEDGWDLRETLPGVFSLHREGMPKPVTVGGYGYSFVTMPSKEAPEDSSPALQQPRRGRK